MRLPEVTRRVFLSRSLVVLGAAAAPACTPGPGAEAPPGLRVLSAGQWQVLAAAADAFIPRGGAFPVGAADLDLARRVDAYLAQNDPALASGLAGALLLLEWLGGPLAGRLGRFSRMDAAGRAAVLEALPRSFGLPRRVHGGLKQVCTFLFYAQPESWQGIGYDGPWV